MRIAANLTKARRSFGTRLIRSSRRRGRAPKPDRRSPSSGGTLPPGPRSRVRNTWWTSTGLDHQTNGERAVGLSWQQGPLSTGAIGRFLVPEPLPKRLLYVERLRRRMRVRFGGIWIADSEHVLLLFEPGRYPVAYFPETDVSPHTLERTDHTTQHPDLGLTSWYSVRAGEHIAPRGAWQHNGLPAHASELQARVPFAWRAMDAFYEEDERIVGHAADSYHRIDIRQNSRKVIVRHRDRIITDTTRPPILYESGFAPRWYVPRADIDESALTP